MPTRLVTTREELSELVPEWHALYARCAETTSFQNPHWLVPWARHFIANGNLRVYAHSEHGRLVAVLPLFVYGEPARAALLGAGISDYLDALVDPTWSSGAGTLSKLLGSAAESVQAIELHDLPDSSPLLLAHSSASNALCIDRSEYLRCPRLALNGDRQAFLNGLPGWLQRNLRQGRNRLNRLGRVEMRVAEPAQVPEFLESLFQLHGKEWQARGQTGVLAENAVQSFHREAAVGLVNDQELELIGLSLDDRLIGVVYSLVRGASHQYLSGIDPDFSRCNLGSLLIFEAIARALAKGFSVYDFLRGEEAYKYAWGAQNHRTFKVEIRSAAREQRVA
jgi:CelD/BcsL family acetyltransferase involved in cellulose biosynthesis